MSIIIRLHGMVTAYHPFLLCCLLIRIPLSAGQGQPHGSHGSSRGPENHTDMTIYAELLIGKYGSNGVISSRGIDSLVKHVAFDTHVCSFKNNSNSMDNNNKNINSLGKNNNSKNNGTTRECVCSNEGLMSRLGVADTDTVSIDQFPAVAAAILYAAQNGGGCVPLNTNTTHDDDDHNYEETKHHPRPELVEVWGYSVLCVTLINLCSLTGMLFIPLMKKQFYHQLLMFMVALAVGTLVGSSLLVLIPGAFGLGDEGSPYRHEFVGKMTVVVSGIYLFFLVERLLHNFIGDHSHGSTEDQDSKEVGNNHSNHNCRKRTTSGCSVISDAEEPPLSSVKIHTLSHVDESMNVSLKVPDFLQASIDLEGTCITQVVEPEDAEDADASLGEYNHGFRSSPIPTTIVCNGATSPASEDPWLKNKSVVCVTNGAAGARSTWLEVPPQEINPKECLTNGGGGGGTRSTALQGNQQNAKSTVARVNNRDGGKSKQQNVKSAVTRVTNGDGGKSPKALEENLEKEKKPKKEIKSVAWMIIFGDGLHNMIDGLSIGAAFAGSTLAGISVSLAVICEELPHELGDFAILLDAGMTMKKALFHNFLSACMCYVGLVIGILVGELENGSQWIFAVAGGMFLYIALCDMLPEVNHAGEEEARKMGNKWSVFILQNAGLLTGYGIMLIMALYAENINLGDGVSHH